MLKINGPIGALQVVAPDFGRWGATKAGSSLCPRKSLAVATIWNAPGTICNYFLFLVLCIFITACNSPYTSKKRGYFNIELPQRSYQQFARKDFPYSFEYPVYAQIVKDSTYFDKNPEDPYWINIDFPQFHGRIFLSYKAIGKKALYKVKQPDGTHKDSLGTNVFDNMVNDAFKLTNKNDVVANAINDTRIQTANGVSGVFFKVGGNAATSRQFFLSDTTRNFIRGALYFDVTPNADSLKPVLDFLQVDMDHMISTFRWTNNVH